eukprot:9134303-Pyramimonas_sp.AAC.1
MGPRALKAAGSKEIGRIAHRSCALLRGLGWIPDHVKTKFTLIETQLQEPGQGGHDLERIEVPRARP